MWHGLAFAKVANTADDGKDGAEVGIATASLLDDFIFHAILLGSEGERRRSGLEELRDRASVEVETDDANHELDVAKPEG